MFNFLNRKSVQKSAPQHNSFNFLNCEFSGLGYGVLMPKQAIDMYLRVAPVADAVNMITDEFKNIEPVVFNKTTSEFIDNHPILDLLKNPNTNQTYHSFIELFGMFLYVTGNNFMVATGPDNRPPVELFIVPPQNVSITAGEDDGMAKSYLTSGGGVYSRPDTNLDSSRYRFFLENTSGAKMAEMWQTKLSSPISNFSGFGGSASSLFGLSPLTPHHFNLQLYIESNIHNLSVLKRGGLPSLILYARSHLDDEQFQRLTRQMEKFNSGSSNAGRKMIVEGEEMQVDQLQSEARDMDFKALQKMVTQDLFRAYKIPPAIVAEDAMKFNNYKESRVTFYESSVLKKLDMILSQITSFLMPRYPNSENLVLTYNRNSIPELEPERMDTLKTQRDLGILSINEVRKELHLDAIMGGDEVYVNSNQIPVADATLNSDIVETVVD